MSSQRKDYILSNDSYKVKTRNAKGLHDTKFEVGSNEAIYEIGSSSDSSDEYNDNMEVEIEIESSKEERKHIHLNEKFMTHYKSNIKKPETTKNQLLNTQKITYLNEFNMRKSYNGAHPSKRCRPSTDEAINTAKEQRNLNYNLRLAVEKGDTLTILKILSKNNKYSKKWIIDLNSQGQDQWTLLHIATNEGNYSVVKILLENGANPNPQSANQRTSLHIGCIRGHLSIVKILLEYGADINIADMDGNTPAHLCSEFGKIAVI
jgi:ankyrin repeat protein